MGFYASATVNPGRVGRDAGRISYEIVSHLTALPRAGLRVSNEMEAEVSEGVSEDMQRTVSENAARLKFDSHGFKQ